MRKKVILSTVASVALLAAPWAALSQTTSNSNPSTAASSTAGKPGQDTVADLQEVVVTGSHIARAELNQPTPVEIVGQQNLKNIGTEDIGQVLAQQPAISFGGTQQAQQNLNGGSGVYTGGLSEVNLRGLGTNRTLTLVDGRRQVGSDPGNVAFDLNSLSSFSVQRVEVITGGASAVYGSDAVSGVVNIITRDKMDGIEIEARGSRGSNGPGASTEAISIAGGKSFNDGRGGFVATLSYDHTEALQADNQPQTLPTYNTISNPAYVAGNGQPNTLLVPNVESPQYFYGGVLNYKGTTLQPTGIWFGANGQPTTIPTAVGTGTLSIYRAFNVPCDLCFKTTDWYTLVPQLNKAIGSIKAHYDLLDSGPLTATVYGDLRYAYRQSDGNGQPINQTTTINVAQNAFLPAAVQAQLLAAGTPTATLTKLWSDLGGRSSTDTRKTLQFDSGVKGAWTNPILDLHYDAYLTDGQSRDTYVTHNQIYTANLAAAEDSVINPATGMAACRVNVPALQPAGYVTPAIVGSASSCAALNPFGTTVSSAARSFVSTSTHDAATLDQFVSGISVTGDTNKFLKLIGGAPLSFAAGYEYRKESASQTFDPTEPLTTQGATGVNSSASYDVNELYFELDAPLVRDMPFAKLISVNYADRYANYSTVKGINSYDIGAIWAPISDFRFRGTYSVAVRAPNLTEEFSPTQTTSLIGTDPCTTTLRNASATRAANCTALGVPAVFAGLPTSIPLITSGNPNLTPETGYTYTVGAAFTPTFLKGFTATIDYYHITIRDAITLLSAIQIADACVDSPGAPNQQYCSLLTRDSNPASPTYHDIIQARSTYVNSSQLTSSGIDFQASYRFNAYDAQWTASVTGTHLDQLRNYLFQTQPTVYTRLDGYLGNPTWKINPSLTFVRGPLTLVLSGRYFSHQSTIDMSPGMNTNFQSMPYMKAEYYQDVYLSYDFKTRFFPLTGYVGATNLFGNNYPTVTTSLRYLTSSYDELGTVVFAGVKGKF